MSTLRGSYGKSKGPAVDRGGTTFPVNFRIICCMTSFRLRRRVAPGVRSPFFVDPLAQKFPSEMSMCVSTAQARVPGTWPRNFRRPSRAKVPLRDVHVRFDCAGACPWDLAAEFSSTLSRKSSLTRCPCAFRLRRRVAPGASNFFMSKGLVLPARRARFLSYVDFVWQAWDIRDMWSSETSFCVAGAGHRTLLQKRGTCATFGTLLKRWQAWLKMRRAFGVHFSWQAQYLVDFDDVLKGFKIAFCETVVDFDFGHDDDFVWQAQYFDDLGLVFRGRRSTSWTSTKKCLRPR